jgi:RimJ/RimL family protein N-acetyltransferase
MTNAVGMEIVAIRRARLADISAIAEMEKIPEFHALVGSWPEEQHRDMLKDPDAAYWVAENSVGHVTGFCILRGLQAKHHALEIKRIVVTTPDKGMGKTFLRFLLEQAFTVCHAHRVWLYVFEDNARAQHFYREFGFQEDGLLREAILRDGQYLSLVLMSLLDREYRQHPQE